MREVAAVPLSEILVVLNFKYHREYEEYTLRKTMVIKAATGDIASVVAKARRDSALRFYTPDKTLIVTSMGRTLERVADRRFEPELRAALNPMLSGKEKPRPSYLYTSIPCTYVDIYRESSVQDYLDMVLRRYEKQASMKTAEYKTLDGRD